MFYKTGILTPITQRNRQSDKKRVDNAEGSVNNRIDHSNLRCLKGVRMRCTQSEATISNSLTRIKNKSSQIGRKRRSNIKGIRARHVIIFRRSISTMKLRSKPIFYSIAIETCQKSHYYNEEYSPRKQNQLLLLEVAEAHSQILLGEKLPHSNLPNPPLYETPTRNRKPQPH